ncbi:hypothetical protein JCM10213_004252 [Rhodosporidiobolus nylandii]
MKSDPYKPTQQATLPFSPQKRPPSPSAAPTSTPAKHPRTAAGQSSAGRAGGAVTGGAKAGKGTGADGAVEEVVLDDSSDDDDLVIVEPAAASDTVKGKGKAQASPKMEKKPAPPMAAIFQKRAPPSPAAASPRQAKGKGKAEQAVKQEETAGKKQPVAENDATMDVKPDVKPTLGSPLKTLGIFDTASASSSTALTSAGTGATSGDGVGYTLRKPLDTPLFSFDPLRDVAFAQPDPTKPPQIPFAFFTSALVLISSTRSRLLIRLVLTNLLRTVIMHSPSALLPTLYLLSNRIAPSYERGTELGVGWQVLSQAIKQTSGVTPARLKQLSNKHGDPGDIAFEASRSVRVLVRPKELTCEGVYGTLRQIAKLKGTGVLAQKTSLVKKLLLSARGEEVRFVVRILVANLRIGAVRLSLLTALARAFCLARPPDPSPAESGGEFWVSDDERDQLSKVEAADAAAVAAKVEKGKGAKGKGKDKAPQGKAKKDKTTLENAVEARFVAAEQVVRRAYAQHPHFAVLVDALLQAGVGGVVERVGVSVGVPVEPMLGSITRSLSDVYTRLNNRPFVSEAKLDGQRGQIHVWVTERPSPSEPAPARPPGAEEGAGIVYAGEDLPGLEGKRVWVRTFSRHLEDMTEKYPDIVGSMAGIVARSFANASSTAVEGAVNPPLRNFVLDCEVVAIDPVSGAYKTFQELSYRSKKDVELGDIKVRVGVYAFDLMYLNDESLLSSPFRHRRTLLRTLFTPFRPSDPRLAKFELIPSLENNGPDAVREFFEECVKMKGEGIMVKLLDEAEVDVTEGEGKDEQEGGDEADEDGTASDTGSGSGSGRGKGSGSEKAKGKGKEAQATPQKGKGRRKVLPATYEPDKRADSWCKVKKDYLEDLGDSLDLVPIGAWHGQGRKAGWWSPFLLAVYDEDTGTYSAVCKCISGFTDAFYKEYKAKYSEDPDNELTSRECYPEIDAGGLRPDVWFRPSEVWEIRGADFTLSPVYPAARAQLGGERGASVRFPRFIKVRDDKGIENATTAEQLAAMYEAQGATAAAPSAGKNGEGAEEGEDDA